MEGVPKSVLGDERRPFRDSEAGNLGVDHDMFALTLWLVDGVLGGEDDDMSS